MLTWSSLRYKEIKLCWISSSMGVPAKLKILFFRNSPGEDYVFSKLVLTDLTFR